MSTCQSLLYPPLPPRCCLRLPSRHIQGSRLVACTLSTSLNYLVWCIIPGWSIADWSSLQSKAKERKSGKQCDCRVSDDRNIPHACIQQSFFAHFLVHRSFQNIFCTVLVAAWCMHWSICCYFSALVELLIFRDVFSSLKIQHVSQLVDISGCCYHWELWGLSVPYWSTTVSTAVHYNLPLSCSQSKMITTIRYKSKSIHNIWNIYLFIISTIIIAYQQSISLWPRFVIPSFQYELLLWSNYFEYHSFQLFWATILYDLYQRTQ